MTENLPKGETYRIASSKGRELFLDFIKMYTLDASKDYLHPYSTARAIDNIKEVRMDSELSLRDIRYTSKGVLYLPEVFFKRKLDTIEDVEDMLEEYPILKELLCTYGIFIAGLHSYGESKEDTEIKKIVAYYIARKHFQPAFRSTKFAGKYFYTGGIIYKLEHNLLQEIEIILGSEAISSALKYGVFSFETKANSLAKFNNSQIDKKYGRTLLRGLIKLSELTAREEILEEKAQIDESIRRKLIIPVYNMTREKDEFTQRRIADRFSDYEFDGKKLYKYRGLDFSTLERLTDVEIDTIKLYILDFKRRLYELQDYLFTSFPQVNPKKEFMGAKFYTNTSFTDFNRIMTMQNWNRHQKDKLDGEIWTLWNSLQILLMRAYLPATNNPYSRICLLQKELKDLQLLSSYRDLEGSRQIKPAPKVMKLISRHYTS